ncbi:MAG: hypothetical protein B6230_01455 [Desulfobacteraceae bacterium 4572_89]|nr:MAG: hypothetical protein B6230_01455 [Desulfobacteraceae bacterium 4572_89]
MNQDYKLANLQNREIKLRAQRQEILTSQSEKALDMILDAPSPASLVQSFPDQDLYFLMHNIGVHDFMPILAMATSAQWEYILDVEVWEDDQMDIHMMTQAFNLLFKADPKRLLRWVITEKPEFFEFYLFKNMTIKIREHDEWTPSDFDDYITLDDKFYFRFPHQEDPDGKKDSSEAPDKSQSQDQDQDQDQLLDQPLFEDAAKLIEKMLRTLAEMDLSVFHGLLLETNAVLSAETEEEQFRLKTLRLAEKGFLPTHEAIGIYQPTDLKALRKRPASIRNQQVYDPEIPLPPQFFTQFIEGDNLFVKSLGLLDPDFLLQLQSEIAALINKIVSADKIKIRNKESIENTIKKATAYLSLGLEVILKGDLRIEMARDIISEYFLEDIFRTGSRAGIQLKTKARKWFDKSFMKEKSLPLSFLSEQYLGVIGGLLIDRPMFYDNYQEGELYRHFKSLADINTTDKNLDQIIHLDRVLDQLPLDINSFTHGVLTYKSLFLTLWARNRIGLDTWPECRLAPIDPQRFKPFFADLFSSHTPGKIEKRKGSDLLLWAAKAVECQGDELPEPFQEVMSSLIKEIEEEYGAVDPANLDPRFINHFLLAPGI